MTLSPLADPELVLTYQDKTRAIKSNHIYKGSSLFWICKHQFVGTFGTTMLMQVIRLFEVCQTSDFKLTLNVKIINNNNNL